MYSILFLTATIDGMTVLMKGDPNIPKTVGLAEIWWLRILYLLNSIGTAMITSFALNDQFFPVLLYPLAILSFVLWIWSLIIAGRRNQKVWFWSIMFTLGVAMVPYLIFNPKGSDKSKTQ